MREHVTTVDMSKLVLDVHNEMEEIRDSLKTMHGVCEYTGQYNTAGRLAQIRATVGKQHVELMRSEVKHAPAGVIVDLLPDTVDALALASEDVEAVLKAPHVLPPPEESLSSDAVIDEIKDLVGVG